MGNIRFELCGPWISPHCGNTHGYVCQELLLALRSRHRLQQGSVTACRYVGYCDDGLGSEGLDTFNSDAECFTGLGVAHIDAVLLRNRGERTDVDLLTVGQRG